LEHTEELKEYVAVMYVYSAQFNDPSIKALFEAIDGATFGSDILSRIMGVLLLSVETILAKLIQINILLLMKIHFPVGDGR
jgi:hypothetical protein